MPREKDGGGRSTKVVGFDWASHGSKLSASFSTLRAAQADSTDPSSKKRIFFIAKPPTSLERTSSAKKAIAGKLERSIDLAGTDSQIIKKLGLDLLAVNENGSAIVHATNVKIDQMIKTLGHLNELSSKEHDRWAHVNSLDSVPESYKTSISWWDSPKAKLFDSIIDLNPYLSREETSHLIDLIRSSLSESERIKRLGKEFTGRTWLAALLKPETILKLAKKYQSIFSIRPRLIAETAGPARKIVRITMSAVKPQRSDFKHLPCVAVMDTGIPSDHLILSPYLRGAIVGEGTSGEVHDHHGSFVASRVIFGDIGIYLGDEPDLNSGACSIYDINIGDGPGRIYSEAIDSAIGVAVATAPDVRVFNLSFDIREPLNSYTGSLRDSLLRKLADLDNRAFSDDLLFVVAAGNSSSGAIPSPAYPFHYTDEDWALRAWSRCFNAITCGGTAERLGTNGVAQEPGGPSPFCRVGPGFANSRKPDFSAHAGNCENTYQLSPGSDLGVGGCNEFGNWEDNQGTSFSAPLLSRDAARTFAFLNQHCGGISRPFSSLVKATLAIFSSRAELSESLRKLADKTLGFGSCKFQRIIKPSSDTAVFFWQGIIDNEDDLVSVELPLPGTWIKDATRPILRIVCAWETPVNHAVEHIWACRRIEMTLRPTAGKPAFKSLGKNPLGYPLTERKYVLKDIKNCNSTSFDFCLAELKYTHVGMAEYPAGSLDFSPQQRVSLVYELYDESGDTSPHEAIQALPVYSTMNRLSNKTPASRQAVSIRIIQ